MSQSSPLAQAFDLWRKAHTQLRDATDEYSETCKTLQDVLLPPNATPIYDNERTAVLGNIDQLLSSFSIHTSTEARFRVEHNRDKKLAPIHSLPNEILIEILLLASRPWITKDYRKETRMISPSQLSGVCELWCQLTRGCPRFWTTIKIVFAGDSWKSSYKQAELWAARSGELPLHVFVRDVARSEEEFDETDPQDLSTLLCDRCFRFLLPLLPRMQSLHFNYQLYDCRSLLSDLLACWVERATPGTAKLIDINGYPLMGNILLPGISPKDVQDPDDSEGSEIVYPAILTETIETLFQSVHSLVLTCTIVDWGANVFSGLVHLRITCINVPGHLPSQEDIANLLGTCARLRSLVLYKLLLVPSPDTTPIPVEMPFLEALGLDTPHMGSLANFLPMIKSTSCNLRLGLPLHDDQDDISAARAFLARVNPTVLHVHVRSDPAQSFLFAHMPSIETLVIRWGDLNINMAQNLVRAQSSRIGRTDLWPRLQRLYLINCMLCPRDVRLLVDSLRPKPCRLRVWDLDSGSNFDSDSDSDSNSNLSWVDPLFSRKFRDEMRNRGTDFEYSIGWKNPLVWEFGDHISLIECEHFGPDSE